MLAAQRISKHELMCATFEFSDAATTGTAGKIVSLTVANTATSMPRNYACVAPTMAHAADRGALSVQASCAQQAATNNHIEKTFPRQTPQLG